MALSVTEVDLGSQIINPQVKAVEKQTQQVSPFGCRLTAQTLLWVLTSERDTPGEGPVIGCHPVTRVLCRLGLLSLPLQNSVSSVREWVPQNREPGGRCKRSHDRGERAAGERVTAPFSRRARRGSAIPPAVWRNFCGLPALYTSQVLGPSQVVICASFNAKTPTVPVRKGAVVGPVEPPLPGLSEGGGGSESMCVCLWRRGPCFNGPVYEVPLSACRNFVAVFIVVVLFCFLLASIWSFLKKL